MIQFTGQVVNGCLTFPRNSESLRGRWLSESEGKFVTERLSRSGPAKTTNQVKTHFGLAVTMIQEKMMELGWDICGVAPNKQMVHEILTMACGGVGELGQTVRLSEMTIEQAMKFFENIRAWAATQLQLNIPDPDRDWHSKK